MKPTWKQFAGVAFPVMLAPKCICKCCLRFKFYMQFEVQVLYAISAIVLNIAVEVDIQTALEEVAGPLCTQLRCGRRTI